ncbi:MAG TPA: hypothetical protein DEB40_01225 [Elusimicrobia bacterium]|nr:hypothetical protein [Elusimicrobiota bacterium]HBT60351.1 hypothetical protein [Elusimicrobiota bacterium]
MISALALGAAVLAAQQLAQRSAPAQDRRGGLDYDSACEIVSEIEVDGYVANKSEDAYQVNGPVSFSFSVEGSISRPRLALTANALVPAGRRVLIAQARLPFKLEAGETCHFDVKDAIRKP